MAYNFEEQEQLDDLKAWWARYGGFLLTVAVVVSVSFAGWRLWGWYQDRQSGEAAVALTTLREAARDEDLSRVRVASTVILDEYGSTIYAPMAALLAARAYVDGGDLPAAQSSLEWVLTQAAESEFAPLARVRLAGVLLDQDKADAGLAVLDAVQAPEAYRAAFADRRGDLLLSLDRRDEARASYERALELAGERTQLGALVSLKLSALGAGS